MSRTLPWGGVYKVTADIGFIAGFELDNTEGYGTLDDPFAALYDTGVGVDITEDVQEITINRGRSTQLDEFSAGTCSITLLDQTRKYDPVNISSPYYDPLLGTSGVTIRRQIKVFYDATQIFTGRITDIDVEFQPTSTPISRSLVTLEVADDFVRLANAFVEEFTPTSQLGGARITTLLALPEVNYTDATDLDTGTITLDTETIPDQTTLLDYLQDIARTEQGYLFVKGDGTLRFSNRLGTVIVTDPFFFADDGTGDADYETLSVMYGQEQLHNRIICTPIDSTNPGVANDATSQTAFGISALHLDQLLCSDADAQTMATYLLALFKDPQYRFDSVSLTFAGSKVSPQTQALIMALDLGSVIRVKKSFAVGTPSTLTQSLSVEGISHSVTPTAHNIVFRTAVRQIAYPWTLNDSSLGVLSTDNALS